MSASDVRVDGAFYVAGVRWAYTERGSGPLVIFFHGTLSGKQSFARTVDLLPSGHRYVAFDWPGHGESTYEPGGWSVDDLVDAVPTVIAGLQAPRAVLVGVSQGGAIGLRVAIRHPQVLAGLVTINSGPDALPTQAVTTMGDLGRTLRDGTDQERRAAAQTVVALYHATHWAERHRALVEHEIDLILSHPREAAVHVTAIPAQYESIEHHLPEISCPTLVIWGENDPRRERGPKMAAAIPHSRLRVLPGCGHHAHVEAPELLSQTLTAFLAQIREDTQTQR